MKWRGYRGSHGQHRWNGRDAQMARKPALVQIDVLLHRAYAGNDLTRPAEDALAFFGEAQEARAAPDQHDAQRILKLPYAGRKRRLGDAAVLRRAAEMFFLCKGDQKLKLVDHGHFLESEDFPFSSCWPACTGCAVFMPLP